MSADTTEMDANLRAFVVDVAKLDAASASIEESAVVVTIRDANAEYAIDATPVHESIRQHGLAVRTTRTDLRADEHVVEVTRHA